MLAIVDSRNRHLYARELSEMHRLRHRVVIGEWGWKIPGVKDGCEQDAFDSDDTVYFLAFDDSGEQVTGCGRFIPTTGPHLFSDIATAP